MSKAGQKVVNVLERMEYEFNAFAQKRKDFVPQIANELNDGLDNMKRSFQDVEDSLNVHARQVEENIGQVISEVTKDAVDGITKAKQYFNDLFDEFKDGKTHKEL